MAKKYNGEFNAMRTKGNNTGVGKKDNIELRNAMVEAVKAQFSEAGLKGIRAVFAIGNIVFTIPMELDSAIERVRLIGKGDALGLLSPLSRPQVIEKITECKPLCTYCELEEMMAERGDKNLGITIEYMWAKKTHRSFNHRAAWHTGENDCSDGYEMKLFNFNTTTGSPTARFVTKKSLEKLGYDFSTCEC